MSLNLLVEIDGENVPLDRCGWVMWGPCGCPRGITLAGIHGSCRVLTEEDAWKQFYDRKRERDKARKSGVRMELITNERWKAEVCDQMKIRCGHPDPS